MIRGTGMTNVTISTIILVLSIAYVTMFQSNVDTNISALEDKETGEFEN
jgi:hypothetical protein